MAVVFREVWRVLRDDGTLWLNLGDAYSAGKNLLGLPWRVRFALQADGWILRSDIIWHKSNPMPESVRDRPTKAHEYLFLMAKSTRYYYDAEAVREPIAEASADRYKYGFGGRKNKTLVEAGRSGRIVGYREPLSGRNLRTVWTIPTQSFRGAHFATFPEKLVETCLLAGTSEKGCCPACGSPWKRIVEKGAPIPHPQRQTTAPANQQSDLARDGWIAKATLGKLRSVETVGWEPTCDCEEPGNDYVPRICWPYDPVPCTVLDMFFGAGTVGVVALKHGRRCIGIELNPAYCEMAAQRIQKEVSCRTK